MSATLIDNVFVSKKLQYNYSSNIVIDDINDDMPSLVILRNQQKCKKEPIKIQTREINQQKITELKNKINQIDWERELSLLNANDAFNYFHNQLVEMVEEIILKQTKIISFHKKLETPS